MSNQYEVLGKAPVAEDLKKLSPLNVHLTIKSKNEWIALFKSFAKQHPKIKTFIEFNDAS